MNTNISHDAYYYCIGGGPGVWVRFVSVIYLEAGRK